MAEAIEKTKNEAVENGYYKNEDGTIDYTREVETGLPPGVNLHEAALTRPHQVEKIISEGGETARAEAAVKSAVDNERSLSTMIPDKTKGADAFDDVDASTIANSTDKIQPVTDVNPAAHEADANTGVESLEGDEAKTAEAAEAAAKAQSEQPAGQQPLKVQVVPEAKAKATPAKATTATPAAKTASQPAAKKK